MKVLRTEPQAKSSSRTLSPLGQGGSASSSTFADVHTRVPLRKKVSSIACSKTGGSFLPLS